MPIPTTVEQFLSTRDINYNLTSSPSAENPISQAQFLKETGAARLIILQDEQGKLQAIVPGDRLLDLNALNQLTGRSLRGASEEAIHQLCRSLKLGALPALPELTGLPTMVDQSLLERDTVVLDSGAADALLNLSQEDFKQLVTGNNFQIGNITVPASPLETPIAVASSDSDQIITAVTSFTNLRIKQRLDETLDFPPLPVTAKKIIELRVNPYADISDLSAIVEMDPSLAAQVVSWAASPYYAAPGKIKSVHDAIVRVLGFDLVLNLALGLSLGKALQVPKEGPHGYTPFWQQAVFGAATVEALVKTIPAEHRPSLGMAYLSGLLHNFGFLVLAEIFPPQFSMICRYAEVNPHISHYAIEKHLLGITRDQLASWLMSAWQLPEEVCLALRYQNDTGYTGPQSKFAKVLNVATHLLRQHGIGDGSIDKVPTALFSELHLDPERAEHALENILDSADELTAIASELAA